MTGDQWHSPDHQTALGQHDDALAIGKLDLVSLLDLDQFMFGKDT